MKGGTQMENVVVYTIVFISYLLLLVAVGLWAKRRTKNITDFYVGGRILGPIVLSGTYYATAQSASAFMGMVGLAYAFGWAPQNYISVPIIIGAVINYLFLSKKLRRITKRISGLTIPDFFAFRYESSFVRIAAAIIIIVSYVVFLIAQFKGGGHIFEITFGVSYAYGILITGVIIAIYVAVGGFLAVAWTDTIQAFVMIFGLITITIVGLVNVGGLTALHQKVAAINTGYVSPWGVGNAWGPMMAISFCILFLLSPMGYPAYLQRFYAMESDRTARTAMPLTYAMLLVASICFGIMGLVARVKIPDLPKFDQAMPMIIKEMMPPLAGGIIIVVLFAALMSTVDSLLIVISSAVVRDVYQKSINPNVSEKNIYLIAVVSTFVLGIIGMLISFRPPAPIFFIGAFSMALIAAAFVPPVVFGLFWRKANTMGAITSIISGVVVVILTSRGVIFKGRPLGLDAFVWGLAASVICMLYFSLTGKPNSQEVLKTMFEEEQ